ncbi:MAG: PDZ protein [Magnetococcales bacterium]|nr:PDZ protein [Magnetococcales bacterium]
MNLFLIAGDITETSRQESQSCIKECVRVAVVRKGFGLVACFRILAVLAWGFWTILLASGCGGSGSGDGSSSRGGSGGDSGSVGRSADESFGGASAATGNTWTTVEKNEFVLRRMREWYLWYDRIPSNLDASRYASPEELLEAARFSERDKWSYIISMEELTAHLSTGEFTGIGVRTSQDSDAKLWIRQVFSDSPAAKKGIRRGDRILKINGRTVAEINASKGWDDAFGADAAGVEVTLMIQRDGATEMEFKLVKSTFSLDAVQVSQVMQQGGTKIAYLVYDSFTNASYLSLAKAFATFKDNGVTEIILDLRYNSGGLIDVAAYLASLLRDASDKDIFAIMRYNDRHNTSDNYLSYTRLSTDLNLSRVIVITTSSTCSASEMVIQGLKPYVTVVTVGSTTCGKPVGMDLVPFADQVLAAVSFEIMNANREADYYNGLAPTCSAKDDMAHELGDASESSLATALSYIAKGACSATALRQRPPEPLKLWPRGLPDQGQDGMW